MPDLRLQPGPRTRLAWLLVAGLLLPLAASAVLVWSSADRRHQLDRVPVAIVNDDKILTDPTPMAAGRALAASLTNPKNADPALDWQLTDSDDAKAGLRSGAYYAVLTIPSEFSTDIVSTGTDQPERGQLSLVSNAAASTTVPYISQQVVAAAATALGNQSTQGYLGNVYDGFNKIASSNQSAADSAGKLADGTSQLSDGASDLSGGAASLSSSLDQLAAGAGKLTDGTASLARGTQQVSTGASRVAQGAGKLQKGDQSLARSANRLSQSATTYARGAQVVATGAARVSTAQTRLAKGNQALATELGAVSRACGTAGASPVLCAALARLERQSRALAAGAQVADRGAAGLARSTALLVRGAVGLSDGSDRISGGARSLAVASGRLAASGRKLASGASQAATGATNVDQAARKLAAGSSSAAAGGVSLASGSSTLSSSASQTNDGAQSLSSGLANGAKQSPTYSDSEQTALKNTVSAPVQLTSSAEHSGSVNGWLMATVVALILWLGSLAATAGRDGRAVLAHAAGPVSTRRLALVQSLPVVGLAAVQAAVVVVTLRLLGVDPASDVWFPLLALLAAVSFSLVVSMLRLLYARTGIVLVVLLLLVQVAALANVAPLETAPRALQVLNGFLPLTAFANAASQLVSGGQVHSPWSALLVLAGWAAVGYAGTVIAVRRHRMHHPVAGMSGVPAAA